HGPVVSRPRRAAAPGGVGRHDQRRPGVLSDRPVGRRRPRASNRAHGSIRQSAGRQSRRSARPATCSAMKRGLQQVTSFAPAVRVLLVSQFAINTGYYLLFPYLAVHMQRDLGLSAWLLGVVLGTGTLSQQGLFLIGGTLSDRFGPRRVIIGGVPR